MRKSYVITVSVIIEGKDENAIEQKLDSLTYSFDAGAENLDAEIIDCEDITD